MRLHSHSYRLILFIVGCCCFLAAALTVNGNPPNANFVSYYHGRFQAANSTLTFELNGVTKTHALEPLSFDPDGLLTKCSPDFLQCRFVF